jgi:hypothetical protein
MIYRHILGSNNKTTQLDGKISAELTPNGGVNGPEISREEIF